MSIGPLLGYIFMATVPISFYVFQGKRFTVFGMTSPEIVMIIILFYSIIVLALKLKTFYFNLLDWITILFVFFSLIPVIISADDLYIAARDYRHLFLTPLFAYILLQICFDKVKQMNIALLISAVILIIGTLPTFPYYLKTGSRLESGFNVITIAIMCSWYVLMLYFTKDDVSNTIYKWINYLLLLYMLMIIFFIGSRAVISGFVISYIFSFFILKKKLYQNLFLIFIVVGIFSFYFSLMFLDENLIRVDKVMTEDYREVSHSIFRITSIEHWTYDLKIRLSIWKKAFFIGLENPLFGAGAAAYRSLHLSTPHNIFLSIFLTSGVLGVLTFLILIVNSYLTFFSFNNLKNYPQITKFFFISFSVLLFVGATNDFSAGRYLLFFILLSAISTAKKLSIKDININNRR